ncbi:MAG: glycoside hydrolase family 30 protein [Polyangia bacterium]
MCGAACGAGSGSGATGAPGAGGTATGGFPGTGGAAGRAAGGSGPAGGDSGGATPTGGGIGGTAGAGGRDAGAGTSGAAGTAGPKGPVTAATGATLVKIDPAARGQTFEDWGTSLCWWANRVGGWSASARNAVVDAMLDPATGLGYNVFRYNIGGGENPSHNHMGQWHQMPGFEPSRGTWDWTADANQRAILQRIVERGGGGVVLEAFSNSPPYWMTNSSCASGSTDGSNNLKDASYADFADYLTEVVKHYRDTWGITFRTLEPLNEPNASWWKANGTQEGCHFSPANQQQIVKAVGASLTAKGLTATTVSASDENSLDDAYNNLRGYDAASLAVMSQMNSHSYSGAATSRPNLRALATSKAKRLWQSESGPLSVTLADATDAALFMAGRIITDLRDLQPQAWIDWQVGDPGASWQSITLDDTKQSWTPVKRFYMHAAFSRFIRPGATLLAVNGPDMVAAIAPDGASIAVVVRNGDTSATKSFTFDLTPLASVGTQVTALRTSRTENLATLTPIAIKAWSFTVTIPAYAVVTLVIPLAP